MLAPWKKSYNQPRQHIKKQRHYFANKDPYSQRHGFSNSHMWIWELGHKESWGPKSWWTSLVAQMVKCLSTCRRPGFDPLAVQGTLKSLFQHHCSKTSVSGVQPLWSNSHMAWLLEKTLPLTIQTFVSKVISLLFNMLSRFVRVFLPKSKCLLISWVQSPSAVILEPKKIKSMFSLFPHVFAMKWWDQMPWSLFSECWVLSQLIHAPLSLSSKGFLVSLHFLP